MSAVSFLLMSNIGDMLFCDAHKQASQCFCDECYVANVLRFSPFQNVCNLFLDIASLLHDPELNLGHALMGDM
jgi:hypothetical protein